MNTRFSPAAFIRSNLKHRTRQYRSLFTGVTLAVIFVTVLVLIVTSLPASLKQYHESRVGTHDLVIFDTDANTMQLLKDNGTVEEYGMARIVAQVSTSGKVEQNTVTLASFDQAALALLNSEIVEGRLPEREGEIALESAALRTLRQTATLDEPIYFTLDVPVGQDEVLTSAVTLELKLVGILNDRNANLQVMTAAPENPLYDFPQGIVSADQPIHERAASIEMAYARLDEALPGQPGALGSFRDELGTTSVLTGYEALRDEQSGDGRRTIELTVTLSAVVAAVLVTIAALAVSNAVRTVLEPRKQQLGLLRAIGATRRQVRSLQRTETAIVTLICLPLGVLAGTLLVRLFMRMIGSFLVLEINALTLLVIIVFIALVIAAASALSIRKAGRTSPMQVVRKADQSRSMKLYKIRSRTTFDPARLLARRNLMLNNSGTVGLTFFLALTVVVASVPALYVANAHHVMDRHVTDILISDQSYIPDPFIEYGYNSPGLTDSDVQEIRSLPQVRSVLSSQRIDLNIVLEDYTDYLLLNGTGPGAYLEFADSGLHSEVKEAYDFDQDLFTSSLSALDTSMIDLLEERVYDGEINVERINSGEEIILSAPSILVTDEGYEVTARANASKKTADTCHNDLFHAGDRLTISLLYTDEASGSNPESFLPEHVNRLDRTVTIGAIVAAEPDQTTLEHVYSSQIGALLTSHDGFTALGFSAPQTDIMIKLEDNLSPEAENYLLNRLETISYRADDTMITSFFQLWRHNRDILRIITVAAAALTLLLLGVCLSMTSSNLNARLLSSQQAIGMMRAVGSSERTIYASFFLQNIIPFTGGAILGLTLSAVINYALIQKSMVSAFSLWALLIPLLVLLAILLVSQLSLRFKVRQILRRSIVDNIRTY